MRFDFGSQANRVELFSNSTAKLTLEEQMKSGSREGAEDPTTGIKQSRLSLTDHQFSQIPPTVDARLATSPSFLQQLKDRHV